MLISGSVWCRAVKWHCPITTRLPLEVSCGNIQVCLWEQSPLASFPSLLHLKFLITKGPPWFPPDRRGPYGTPWFPRDSWVGGGGKLYLYVFECVISQCIWYSLSCFVVVYICPVMDQAMIITGGHAIPKVRLVDEEDEVLT